jgi:hypothetical protein
MHGLSTGGTTNVVTFEPRDTPQSVWASGDVRVSAIRSTHIPGHASYRADTPAGSVVIAGDAGNDKPSPRRDYSTSDQVEKLTKGTDVIVHSVIQPTMATDKAKRLSSTRVLPAEHRGRPLRNGAASRRQAPHAYASHCTTWGRPVGALQVACGVDGS